MWARRAPRATCLTSVRPTGSCVKGEGEGTETSTQRGLAGQRPGLLGLLGSPVVLVVCLRGTTTAVAVVQPATLETVVEAGSVRQLLWRAPGAVEAVAAATAAGCLHFLPAVSVCTVKGQTVRRESTQETLQRGPGKEGAGD